MSACEKCWADSGSSNVRYVQLVKEREMDPCTPKEQAGEYWDEKTQSDCRGGTRRSTKMHLTERLRRLSNTEDDEPLDQEEARWGCQECGALSMHYTWFNKIECWNCDHEDDDDE